MIKKIDISWGYHHGAWSVRNSIIFTEISSPNNRPTSQIKLPSGELTILMK